MNIEERLAHIEARLSAIEKLAKPNAPQPAAPAKAREEVAAATAPKLKTMPAPSWANVVNTKNSPNEPLPVTNILGWAGATALVLACIYLVSLAIDAGWLTPARQVTLAMLAGFVCIGIGLLLREKDMHYASLLPAAGIVALFLSIYGAHNYYHLINTTFATSGVIGACLISLWLNRLFLSELYALFAVVGSYTAPVLLGGMSNSIVDLIIYFACWSVVFSIFSVWVQKRSIYILAMYMALVIFDLKWYGAMPAAWIEALVFQTAHFLIFVTTASLFSIKVAPMSQEATIAHIPALVLFYFVQYHILSRHVPGIAPWIAAGSAVFLLACYFIVHHVLKKDLAGGRMLLSSYVALVLVHAGYIESVPAQWAPWVGLAVMPLVAAYAAARGDSKAPGLPLWLAATLIFVVNYLHILSLHTFPHSGIAVPAYDLLPLCYAAELYICYILLRKIGELQDMGLVALYAGHIAIMAWAVQFFDSRFIVTLIWGILAVGCLILALQRRDKCLGQSSLLVFAASAFKALLYDIALAAPLIRIASLLVLGVSLYLGGWLYKKVANLK